MGKKSVRIFSFIVMLSFFVFTPSAFATTFNLVPPTGTLTRGQDITFTINIDTKGAVITSIQSGLAYDATLLKYISVTAGGAMNTITADSEKYGSGKVLFTGTNNTGYNGSGVYATVVFNIIAQSPGATDICSIWSPDPTPTPAPTSIVPTSPPPATIPTLPPQPTALPQTGISDSRDTALIFAASFLAAAGGVFYLSQKQKYSFPNPSAKKHVQKSKVDKK